MLTTLFIVFFDNPLPSMHVDTTRYLTQSTLVRNHQLYYKEDGANDNNLPYN